MLNFSDGIKLDTSGKLRIVQLPDGFYVIGEGLCCPVDDRQDGIELIKSLKGDDDGN